MSPEEGLHLIDQAFEQIEHTTDHLTNWKTLLAGSEDFRANEDAQIYEHLRTAFARILEPGSFSPQGEEKRIYVRGHELTVKVTHRAPKLEDVHGVDVVYNFSGWKALAFQHKKRSANGKFAFGEKEELQRAKIEGLCTTRCEETSSMRYILPECASLYVIGDSQRSIRHVVSSCQLHNYRRNFSNSSIEQMHLLPHPADLETVDGMFLQCIIGQKLNPPNIVEFQRIQEEFLSRPDLVFNVFLKRLPELFNGQ